LPLRDDSGVSARFALIRGLQKRSDIHDLDSLMLSKIQQVRVLQR
jgi:hypothetical protein